MSIESVYENRMRDRDGFNGYNKNDKPPKEKLQKTEFEVGDEVTVQDKGVMYI